MKILFTASECVPFIKTGGLADVVGALAPVLAKKGHDVRVILPMYTAIAQKWQEQMQYLLDFDVQLGWRRQYCGVQMLKKDGVIYYFLDNKYYFGRPYIYGLGGDEYERYGFFCRACLNALPLLDFSPDILHAHDWQSGMIPALLKIRYAHLPFYAHIRTMFTIHNLQYQGIFGIKDVQDVLGLGDGLWSSDKLECFGCANFMKAGLVYADAITTVSPSYAEEITTASYGERLDGLIRARHGGPSEQPEGPGPGGLRDRRYHERKGADGRFGHGRRALHQPVQLGRAAVPRPSGRPLRHGPRAGAQDVRGRGLLPDALAV